LRKAKGTGKAHLFTGAQKKSGSARRKKDGPYVNKMGRSFVLGKRKAERVAGPADSSPKGGQPISQKVIEAKVEEGTGAGIRGGRSTLEEVGKLGENEKGGQDVK